MCFLFNQLPLQNQILPLNLFLFVLNRRVFVSFELIKTFFSSMVDSLYMLNHGFVLKLDRVEKMLYSLTCFLGVSLLFYHLLVLFVEIDGFAVLYGYEFLLVFLVALL